MTLRGDGWIIADEFEDRPREDGQRCACVQNQVDPGEALRADNFDISHNEWDTDWKAHNHAGT